MTRSSSTAAASAARPCSSFAIRARASSRDLKPAPFAYEAPTTLGEALGLLERYGDEAFALAGGQSLIPVLNFRLARPSLVVDVNGVAGLHGVDAGEAGLRVGAL